METEFWFTRLCIQRSLAIVYLIAFVVAVNQFRALCGENGLLPANRFLARVSFWQAPSLFHGYYSDRFFSIVAYIGVVLALIAFSGLADAHGIFISLGVWFSLWALYLSIVSIGQIFYGFGWESILLETGFLAIFLGPSSIAPSPILFWLFAWVLFRVMFGAGMIKLRGDACWRDLTCMMYHYETQPLPNPLSYYLHKLPRWFHQFEVAGTHFLELIVPFFYFAPAPLCYIAGGLTILFQLTLILSGNLSWLNYITLALCIACFKDNVLQWLPIEKPVLSAMPLEFAIAIYLMTAMIFLLSIRPALNLFSPRQIMNRAFDPFHLVCTYGAFGSITKQRFEIIVEGTDEPTLTASTKWREYEFKAKPGNIRRMPPIIAPYHLRLDWLMWFAAMSSFHFHPWIIALVDKLLIADQATLKLLKEDPFEGKRPAYIRLRRYRYRFSPSHSRTGQWWEREFVGEYFTPQNISAKKEHLENQMGYSFE